MKRAVRLLIILFFLIAVLPAAVVSGQSNQPAVYVVSIAGEITPAMAAFLESTLARANREGAKGIIIEISTLGGQVVSAIQMRDAIFASDAPVVVYIGDRAISAGALISIAADTIIMAPGSHLGSAEPVPNEPKALAYVSGEFRTTAERTGRDPTIAMAMVDASIEIAGLVEKGKILDLTAQEADQLGFIEHLAANRAEVLQVLGWANSPVVEAEPDFRYQIAQFLTSYEVSAVLLLLGMIGLVAELFIPGFGAAGILGISCFILYFAGGFIAGHTEWWSAIIFLAGIILLIIEIAAPGFGIFGITGIIALSAGIIFAAPNPSQGIGTLLIALVATIIAIPIFFKIFGQAKFMRRLVLTNAETVAAGYIPAAGRDHLLGQTGTTLTVLRPSGSVSIDGMRIDALAEGEFIDQGIPVQVIRVEGAKVVVSAINE